VRRDRRAAPDVHRRDEQDDAQDETQGAEPAPPTSRIARRCKHPAL
jgi:hypothetical protein